MSPSRRTDLTPEALKRITDAIRLGAPYLLAAQYGGVSKGKFSHWMKRGEAAIELSEKLEQPIPLEDAPYADFVDAVHKAEGDALIGWLAKIEREANEGSWQAAAWKAERRYPNDFGKSVVRNEVVGDEGGPVQVKVYLPNNGRPRVGYEENEAQ